MERRFMAVLLAGGLVLALCGCGGDSGTATASAPVATEESNVAEEDGNTEEIAQEVAQTPEAEEEPQPEQTETVEPEISEPEVTPEETEAPTIDIDTSALLTTHVVEYEDQDGYTIRETCQLSPIFREDDAETMYALWEALGNDMADFPSEESLYGASYLLRDARDTGSCDKLEYIIGTYTIENLTEGFPITPDNPRSYVGSVHAEYVFSTDEEHNANASTLFNKRSVSAVLHSDGMIYYGEQDAVIIGGPKMSSDVWGPVTFVIALPNGSTPNQPNGYPYDKIEVQHGSNIVAQGSNVFELHYFIERGD